MGIQEYENLRRAMHNPETVYTMLEDYRAGLVTDRLHEEEDRRNGCKIECPVLCLWSEEDDMGELYDDIPGIWKRWARDVRGEP